LGASFQTDVIHQYSLKGMASQTMALDMLIEYICISHEVRKYCLQQNINVERKAFKYPLKINSYRRR